MMDPISPLQNHSYESFPTPLPSSADAATNQEMAFIDPKRFQSSFDDAYEDLQNLANWLLRSERSSITLQSDDLVHEAFLRLTRSNTPLQWENRRQLVNLIIETMRRILIDHARRKATLRSGGAHSQVPWEDGVAEHASETPKEDEQLIDLTESITKLAQIHKSAAEVVNLRFFAGLTFDEISNVLEKPRSTIYREWLAARAWLKAELTQSRDN